jgi:tRNA(His) guanylyltransferase
MVLDRFSECHKFNKPNDLSSLQLMDACAAALMETFHDIILAYGQSDEYSFVLKRNSTLYERRSR